MTKYRAKLTGLGKAYDVDDIRYILKEYSDGIPEEIISDIYWKLLEYVPKGFDHINPKEAGKVE